MLRNPLIFIPPSEFTLPPEGMVLAKKLENVGFISPIFYGGALRDAFRGAAYNDLDIKVAVEGGRFQGTNRMIKTAMELLKDIPEIRVTGMENSYDGNYGEHGSMIHKRACKLDVIFNYEGREIDADIVVMKMPSTLGQVVRAADAPINSLAVDTQGNTLAHPEFESDIEGRWYAIMRHDPDDIVDSVKRFVKIRQRFEGLELYLDTGYMGETGVKVAKAAYSRYPAP